MRIALATYSDLPDWEVDDRLLHAALRDRGVEVSHPTWDDETVDWSAFDACLIRTTWDYMEKRAAYVAWADRVGGLIPLFNPPDIVRWNTHKTYLRDLSERGAPIAPTIWLERGEATDARRLMQEHGWTRGFIKPQIGATARETLRFHVDETGLASAQAHLDRTLAREGMMIQPFLTRVEIEGEYSAIFVDGEITHTVRKVPVPGDYRVQDDFGAHDEPFALPDEARSLARSVMGLVDRDLLYGRVDMLRDDCGSFLLSELELVEPSMFFRHCPEAAVCLADALVRRVAQREQRKSDADCSASR